MEQFKGMLVKNITQGKANGVTAVNDIIEFDSLDSFYKYITETEYNNVFKNLFSKSSLETGYSKTQFTKTKTFDEATELFKNGWTDMAIELTQKLKAAEQGMQPSMKSRPINSVHGYHPIVPMYLNNQPNAMVNNKMVPIKQKVVTLNKAITYNAGTSADTIIEESVKALQIVKKLEAQGIRVNLNILMNGREYDYSYIMKIRVKSANERLNISKLAFVLVHPSMLRRLVFRFVEVFPSITKTYTGGYGYVIENSVMRKYMNKGEYLLPPFIKKDISTIKTPDDLENI